MSGDRGLRLVGQRVSHFPPASVESGLRSKNTAKNDWWVCHLWGKGGALNVESSGISALLCLAARPWASVLTSGSPCSLLCEQGTQTGAG